MEQMVERRLGPMPCSVSLHAHVGFGGHDQRAAPSRVLV
jgi:hypothetical protein